MGTLRTLVRPNSYLKALLAAGAVALAKTWGVELDEETLSEAAIWAASTFAAVFGIKNHVTPDDILAELKRRL